jgi:hypothetical protein
MCGVVGARGEFFVASVLGFPSWAFSGTRGEGSRDKTIVRCTVGCVMLIDPSFTHGTLGSRLQKRLPAMTGGRKGDML